MGLRALIIPHYPIDLGNYFKEASKRLVLAEALVTLTAAFASDMVRSLFDNREAKLTSTKISPIQYINSKDIIHCD